ncbi:hypothetical protein HDV00_005671 [Rhizophlyctis rosea]|nr:hypothetical protein HDV00_005671 [Rhizophlyctis rosea]
MSDSEAVTDAKIDPSPSFNTPNEGIEVESALEPSSVDATEDAVDLPPDDAEEKAPFLHQNKTLEGYSDIASQRSSVNSYGDEHIIEILTPTAAGSKDTDTEHINGTPASALIRTSVSALPQGDAEVAEYPDDFTSMSTDLDNSDFNSYTISAASLFSTAEEAYHSESAEDPVVKEMFSAISC